LFYQNFACFFFGVLRGHSTKSKSSIYEIIKAHKHVILFFDKLNPDLITFVSTVLLFTIDINPVYVILKSGDLENDYLVHVNIVLLNLKTLKHFIEPTLKSFSCHTHWHIAFSRLGSDKTRSSGHIRDLQDECGS